MTLTSDDAKRIREACEAWQPLSPMPAVFLTAAQVALPQVPDLIEEVERLRRLYDTASKRLDAGDDSPPFCGFCGEQSTEWGAIRAHIFSCEFHPIAAERRRAEKAEAELRTANATLKARQSRLDLAEAQRDAFKAALQETHDTMVRAWVAMGDERTPQNAGTAQRVAAVFEAHAASLAAERDEAREQFGDLQEDYTELELELQDVRQQRDALAAAAQYIADQLENVDNGYVDHEEFVFDLEQAGYSDTEASRPLKFERILTDRIRRERAEAEADLARKIVEDIACPHPDGGFSAWTTPSLELRDSLLKMMAYRHGGDDGQR